MSRGVPPMKLVWRWRSDILDGVSVKQIAETSGFSESTVRNYTKSERQKVKRLREEARYQAELRLAIREANQMSI